MLNSNGIAFRKQYAAALAGEAPCVAPHCRDLADQAAPVPMCGKHLRLAFAFVLASEQPDLADHADRLPYWAPTAAPTGWVYFIRMGDLLKIGYTSQPKARMTQLQPSEVLHMEPGTMADEKRCHLAFRHLRVEGELFRPEADLLAFIADLQCKTAA